MKAYLHTIIIGDTAIDFEDDIIFPDEVDSKVIRNLSITVSKKGNTSLKFICDSNTDIDLLTMNLKSLRDELDSFIKHIEYNRFSFIRPSKD